MGVREVEKKAGHRGPVGDELEELDGVFNAFI